MPSPFAALEDMVSDAIDATTVVDAPVEQDAEPVTDAPARELDFNVPIFGVLTEGEKVRYEINRTATSNDKPVRDYSSEELEHLLTGTGPNVETGTYPMAYEGVLTKITRLYLSKDLAALKPRLREAIERAATTGPCPDCSGSRLNAPARACTIANTPITTCHAMPATDLQDWLARLDLPTATPLITQLRSLLCNLTEVGLGYLALDRPTSTLSGGETFLVSLSLALALSERIQLAGRTRFDFFFLDEGFGALDARTLDVALSALERLRGSRRVIGMISHVAAIEERVPRTLRVEPARPGGSAELRQETR